MAIFLFSIHDIMKKSSNTIINRVFSLLLTIMVALQAWAAFVGPRTDFRDESIYFVITTRFYDGDPGNNAQCWDAAAANSGDPCWRGDFKGLIDKLDYIKALGFTAVWVTPIVENASGLDYHGYHASNFSRVDHRYESGDTTFQTLIDEAHARGMKILLDVVLNHTGNFGEEHLCKLFTRDWTANQFKINECMLPYTTDSVGGKLPTNYSSLPAGQQYDARLKQMKNTDNQNHDTHNYWHHFGQFNWDDNTRWWAQIAGDCVDLNTENPAVADYLIDCYGSFIKMGVDGFRIDTGGHISRLTFNKIYIPAFQALGEQYKSKRLNQADFYLCTEVCARYQGSVTYRNQPALSPYFYTWAENKNYSWNNDPAYWDGIAIYESTNLNTLDNIGSCQQMYADNNKETSSAMPTSTNAVLNGNDYHAPDVSRASGLNVIDFPVHYSFHNIASVWNLAMDGDKYYNDATYNVVYVDSHDYSPGPNDNIRFNEGTAQWAENLSLMFSFRGIPCLYYGSEIEFKAGKTIDPGGNGPLRDSGRAYYGGYIKGDVTVSDFGQSPAVPRQPGRHALKASGEAPATAEPHPPGCSRPAQGSVQHHGLHVERRLCLQAPLHRQHDRQLCAGDHQRPRHLYGRAQRHLHRLHHRRCQDRDQRHPDHHLVQRQGQHAHLCALDQPHARPGQNRRGRPLPVHQQRQCGHRAEL